MPQTLTHHDTFDRLGVSPDGELLGLLDASSDCIKIIDLAGRVAFMNADGLCAMHIDSPADILGKCWSDLWPADTQGLVEDSIDAALDGESMRFEAFCPTASGQPRWWDVSVSPMQVDGATRAILSISRDISDRVLREQRAEERERAAIRKLREALAGSDMPVSPRLEARVGPEETRRLNRQEARRLTALTSLAVLDSEPDPRLDQLTKLASELLGMPTALLSLVDHDRQWFLSRVGMELSETPRSQSFCSIAIQTPEKPFIVEDATKLAATRDNPLVTGEGGIRSYLGIPLVAASGDALGSFCVIDTQTRTFDDAQVQTLRTLADAALAIVELKHAETRARRAEIVNAELKHRMGNTYAQVSSLVGLISQSAESVEGMAEQLRDHINALSRTQARIAQGGWRAIDLCGLADELFDAEDTRITCDIDPNFDITPTAAFLLTLAMQELSTNSRKHGALRHEDQAVSIRMRTTGTDFTVAWEEQSPPTEELAASTPRSGFGRKLLTRIVPLGLGGTGEMTLRGDGLSYQLTLPRDRVEMPS